MAIVAMRNSGMYVPVSSPLFEDDESIQSKRPLQPCAFDIEDPTEHLD